MASLDDILGALNTKEVAVDTAEVAGDLKASVEGTRKQLKRLKDRGYVGGDSQGRCYSQDNKDPGGGPCYSLDDRRRCYSQAEI